MNFLALKISSYRRDKTKQLLCHTTTHMAQQLLYNKSEINWTYYEKFY